MRYLITALFVAVSLHANVKQELYHLYQMKKYKEACSTGMRHFQANRKNTEFVSLYAFSCLKSDYIDRLSVPISILKHSKESRANAAYLSVILMQKKLLYHALIDGYDLSSFQLPMTDYVLSRVFYLYVHDDNKQKRDVYTYQDPEFENRYYKLYLIQSGEVEKMVVDEYYDTILAYRHIYW